jgi:predicted O-methyltransferase YrrM
MTTRERLHALYNPTNQTECPVRVPGLNRAELVRQLGEWGFTRWVEVGVSFGNFAKIVLETIPGCNYTGVDPYRRVVEGYPRRPSRREYAMASSIVAPYTDARLWLTTSLEGAKRYRGYADAIFIDGDHAQARQDLDAWAPKLRPGGVMIGHDYYMFKKARVGLAVVEAAQSFTKEHNITEWYITSARAEPLDRVPSFFWAND